MRWPVEGRVARVLTELLAKHPDQRVAVVAHNGVISAALAWFFPERRMRWWTTVVGNCSITRITVDGSRINLLAVNETGHLGPVEETAQPPARAVRAAKRVMQRKRGRRRRDWR